MRNLIYILARAREIIPLDVIANNAEVDDYLMLSNAVIQKELLDEIEALEEMLVLGDETKIKARFSELCLARDARNRSDEERRGTVLHFVTNPYSPCNELYFNLAKALYPNATFQEIFKLLLPDVTKVWTAELVPVFSPTSIKPKLMGDKVQLSEKTIDHPNNQIALMPVELDSFKRLLILDQHVFALDDLDGFDFDRHKQFHQQLTEKNKLLKTALVSHNEALRELYTAIERLNGVGATLREVITPIVLRMTLSGSKAGSGINASEEGSKAAQRLVAYQTGLPGAIRGALNECKNDNNSSSFSKVMENIEHALCIEMSAGNLEEIMANPANQAVLDTRPLLDPSEVEALVKQYSPKKDEALVDFNGALITTALPANLTQVFYQKIVITELEQLVTYLLSFPASEYESLVRSVQIDVNLGGHMKALLALLNNEQHLAFVDALLKNRDKFVIGDLFYGFVAADEKRGIDAFSLEQRLQAINEKNDEGVTILHRAIVSNPLIVCDLLDKIPEEKRSEALKQNDNDNNGVLGRLVAKSRQPAVIEFLQPILNNLDPHAQFLVVAVLALRQQSMHKKLDSLPAILKLLPKGERMSAIDLKSLWMLSGIKLELFRDIVSLFTKDELLSINEVGTDLLHFAISLDSGKKEPQILNAILTAASADIRFELFQEATWKKIHILLHLAMEFPQYIPTFLRQIPEDKRLAMVNLPISKNGTILHQFTFENPDLLPDILNELSPSDRWSALLNTHPGLNVLQMLFGKPTCMRKIFNMIPAATRLQVLIDKNFMEGKCLLEYLRIGTYEKYSEILNTLLSQLTEAEILVAANIKDSKGERVFLGPLGCAKNLEVILNLLSEDGRRTLKKQKELNEKEKYERYMQSFVLPQEENISAEITPFFITCCAEIGVIGAGLVCILMFEPFLMAAGISLVIGGATALASTCGLFSKKIPDMADLDNASQVFQR